MADNYKPSMGFSMLPLQRPEMQLQMTAKVFKCADDIKKYALKQESERNAVPDEKLLAIVRAYVSSENPEKPYSDEQIREHIEKNGLEASKLSVIAARKELQIPASADRYK